MFQAKYFHTSNIFDVEESSRCSFAWRSIMQTRVGVLRGARWRVGDGKDINIWKHRWLPSEGGGGILSPQLNHSLHVVSDLFQLGFKRWNEELINLNLFPWEAEAIRSIPVS